MGHHRRVVLAGLGGIATSAAAVPMLRSRAADAVRAGAVSAYMAPGVARTVAVSESREITGRSEAISIEETADPPGGGGRAIHVVSTGGPTLDYGFSLVAVRRQGLTVADIESFTYEWLVTADNTIGPDRAGEGPDEVWLILGGSAVRGRREVFRTLNTPEGTETWHTRAVHDELSGLERSPWKELSEEERDFVEVGPDLVDAYGDADVLGVGIGRGDPVMGPSTLDAYYRDLELNGEAYALPPAGGG